MSYLLAEDIEPIRPPISGMVGKKPEAVFGSFISGLVGAILVFATIWVLFQLVQAGLEWIGSGGDKTGTENARNRITNALIGLLIVFASWSIYLVILQFLGLSPIGSSKFEFKFPSLI